MSELEKQEGDRGIVRSPESKAMQAQDAQAARVAGASEVKAAQDSNPNRHNGGAGGDQNQSIEIVSLKESGGFDLIASRLKGQGPQNELPATESKAKTEPLTVDFLKEKARQGDIWAKSFMPEIEGAERIPAGPTRDLLVDHVLKKAEVVFRPEDRRKAEPALENQNDTGTIIAARAEQNKAVEAVKAHHDWASKLEPGPEKDKHKQLAREQLVQLEPQAKGDLERLDQKRKWMAEQENAGTHDIRELRKRHLEGHVEHWENPWQAFTKLTPDQQRDIIRAFEKAGKVGQEGYEQKIQQVAESVPRAFYNVGKAVYDSGIAAATFVIESAQRPEKVPEAARNLAGALSESIANGARISQFVAGQAQEMAKTGDYSPVAEGLKTIAETANDRWEAMPLEKRTEKASELIAEMGLGSIIGAADRLAKSGKLIDALEDIAKHLKDLTAPGRDKAKQAIGAFLDDVFQPKGVTTNGFEMPIPKQQRDLDDLVMLRNKGLPDHVKPSERVTVKESFTAQREVKVTIDVPKEVLKAAEIRGIAPEVFQEKLQKIAESVKQVAYEVGNYDPKNHGSERVYGTKFHEALREALNQRNDPLIHTEVSYAKQTVQNWGKLGTSRVDIAIGEKEKPIAIICLKTLKALPSAQQERGWFNNIPRFPDGSVIPRLYLKVQERQ